MGNITRIANPTYDVVFKYLMEDQRAARIVLSAILGKNIVKVQSLCNEMVRADKEDLKLMRLDYVATIREEGGEEYTVTIELQKAFAVGEVERFRKYLSLVYNDADNLTPMPEEDVVGEPDGPSEVAGHDDVARHIYAIYLLGHNIGGLEEAITYFRPTYYNRNGEQFMPKQKIKFVESLTHDMIVVQINRIVPRNNSALDRILSVFKVKDGQEHSELVDCTDDLDTINDDVNHLLGILYRASLEPKLVKALDLERELTQILQYRRQSHETMAALALSQKELESLRSQYDEVLKAREELERAREESERAREESDRARMESDRAREESDRAREESERARMESDRAREESERARIKMLSSTVSALRSQGMSDEQIAQVLSVSVDDVRSC